MRKYSDRVSNIINKREAIEKKHKKILKNLCSISVISFIGICIIGVNFTFNLKYKDNIINEQVNNQELLKFNSKEELVKKIKKQHNKFRFSYITDDLIVNDMAESTLGNTDSVFSGTSKFESSEISSKNDYSETNVQVHGVDEADIVKTNGDYIYYLANNKLNIFDVKTDKILYENVIEFDKSNNIIEMYLDDKYIVVIANCYNNITNVNFNTVKLYIYDVTSYKLLREVETEGSYLSSRKIQDDIYIVTNKNIYSYLIEDIEAEEYKLPIYKDSVISNKYQEINVKDIAYFNNSSNTSFMMVTSLNLGEMNENVNIATYLGAGDEIYVSKNSLYVANVEYNYSLINEVFSYNNTQTTSIHKFKISDGKIDYISTGKVKGALLNQFSMDEYNSYFRITTTKNGEQSENNLYILDENMNIIGELKGLAKGERIYSTRFMGDKCYIVTYKTVDPLFVIDLSNPTNPTVLGELKIPGYSSYLHPIGDNYLLGFGEDTVERVYINWNGEEEKTAYANGLKMAIFDVTDYTNPKELYSVKLGGRGSYSELLYNHKSFLLDQNEGIVAFPVSLFTENNNFNSSGIPLYGTQEFSGVVVYDFSIVDGFNLRGRVNHEKAQRVLKINNLLYTVSNNVIKSSDIEKISLVDSIEIK